MIKPLLININAKSPVPIYEQVKLAIKLAVFSGQLAEGDQLTSIRDLSAQLKINPNTIIKVYSQLEAEGFIASRHGSGFYVKLDPRKIHKERAEAFEELSDEYVHKALGLGYTVDDILKLFEQKSLFYRPNKSAKEPPYASG
jgi:DNA-binding transcriptional regulator YhcF (GntR family)